MKYIYKYRIILNVMTYSYDVHITLSYKMF